MDRPEGRIFARNNLDVEVLYLESALVQRALIAGEIQFGEMTARYSPRPAARGDIVMVLGFVDRLLFRLVARAEPQNRGGSKRKSFGTSRFGAASSRCQSGLAKTRSQP